MTLQNFWIAIPVLVALQTGVSAQSLADVAAAEAARRKTVKSGGKVYTNEDLGNTPSTSPAPASEPASAGKPGASTDAANPDPVAKPDEKKPVDPAKTEKYWKDRAATIQQSLTRNKLLLEALQTQV